MSDVADKLRAEDEDSLISARKIRQPILSKDDINNAFDDITYQKGASVIGMFENWMGPEEFRKGVQSYLKQYAFRATTAGEFLDSLSTSSKTQRDGGVFDVPEPGGRADGFGGSRVRRRGKPRCIVEQQRFLPLGSKGFRCGVRKQTWQIPLCVRYGTGTAGQSQCTLMTQASQTVALKARRDAPHGCRRTIARSAIIAWITKAGCWRR